MCLGLESREDITTMFEPGMVILCGTHDNNTSREARCWRLQVQGYQKKNKILQDLKVLKHLWGFK